MTAGTEETDPIEDVEAFFVPDGDRYVATPITQGPWSAEHQHGGPVIALLAHAIEQVPTLVPMRCGRLTVDLMRPVPVAALEAKARVVREGKRIQVAEAVLVHDGLEVARATALRVRRGASADALTYPGRPDESPPPPPTGVDQADAARAARAVPGIVHAIDMQRVVGGFGEDGASCIWFRLRVPVVAGVETSPFVRLAALSDFTSGTGNFLPADRWSSINADVTLHVLREPVGEWIAVDAVTHAAGDGIGHSRATLSDTIGMVGTGTTVQVIDEVAAPFADTVRRTG